MAEISQAIMGTVTCTNCGTLPATHDDVCVLCWFVDVLARQHAADEHDEPPIEACIACTRGRAADKQRALDEYKAAVSASHADCTHPKTKSARTVCREHRRLEQNLPRKLTKHHDDC
jgi:hypothetical protein